MQALWYSLHYDYLLFKNFQNFCFYWRYPGNWNVYWGLVFIENLLCVRLIVLQCVILVDPSNNFMGWVVFMPPLYWWENKPKELSPAHTDSKWLILNAHPYLSDFTIHVFLFYCWRTNYHEFRGVNKIHFSCSSRSSAGQESWWVWPGSTQVTYHKAKIKVQAGWTLIWRLWRNTHFQDHSDCWQKPVPCDYRTEVPVFLLAVSQSLTYAPRYHLHSLSFIPLYPQSSKGTSPAHAHAIRSGPLGHLYFLRSSDVEL